MKLFNILFRKKRMAVFFLHAVGTEKRFDIRALYEITDEKNIAETFYNWTSVELKKIKDQGQDAVIVNMNIIR